MSVGYRHLSWDSQTFGFKVAEITEGLLGEAMLSLTLSNLRSEGYLLAYCFASMANEKIPLMIKTVGGGYAGSKVFYKKDIYSLKEDLDEMKVQILSNSDFKLNSEFISLALESGRFSRFHLDPKFPRDLFIKLYTLWIEGSIQKRVADEVLISKKDDFLEGFITVKQEDNCGAIGLLAVDPKCRNMGVGSRLIKSAEVFLAKNGCTEIKVATQFENKRACIFYEKIGFKRSSSDAIYHFWLDR